MRFHKVLVVGFVLVLFAMAGASTGDVVARLKKSYPAVDWNAKSATIADVDCDGKADTIVFGTEKNRIAVAVVAGGSGKPQLFFFPVSAHTQDGFCAVPVRIEVSPLPCDSPVGPLQGCKPSKSCKAFSVVDDECDPFNFYWDSSRKSFRWWRN